MDPVMLSRQLMLLQAKENNGRGITCVRSIASDLERGDIHGAKAIAHHDWDKIANYPDIAKWLKQNQIAEESWYVNE